MKRILTSLMIICVLVYISFGLLLYVFQGSFLYFPTQVVQHHYDDQLFEHDGERINAMVVNQGKEKALIYFGGNGEAIALKGDLFQGLFSSYTIYLIEYRGYGKSSGTPTEQGNFSDALFIYDQIQPQHPGGISLFGRSLGSGVASYLAANRNIDRLILVTPYDSILAVAQALYPIYPIKIILKDHYDSLSRVPRIKAKTLIVTAENDQVINAAHSKKLVDAFPSSQLQHEVIQHANHDGISDNPDYNNILMKFMQ